MANTCVNFICLELIGESDLEARRAKLMSFFIQHEAAGVMKAGLYFDYWAVIPAPANYPSDGLIDQLKSFINRTPRPTNEMTSSEAVDWCKEHWGTKWFDQSKPATINDSPGSLLIIKFFADTAWSPPNRLFQALAKQIPGLQITIQWADASDEDCGRVRILGDLYEETNYRLGGLPPDVDEPDIYPTATQEHHTT